MTPMVHILLPVHDRRAITEKFIDCLVAQTYTKYHLILIDDGSKDGTDEMVRSKIRNLTILKGKGSWWWAGGLQRGIDWLKENCFDDETAIVLIINDDVTFRPDYLERAVKFIGNRTGFLLLSKFSSDSGNTVSETGVIADLRRLTFRTAGPGEEGNCLSTRGLFVRLLDVKTIGNFYPRLLPHYLSDYEYTIRAKNRGFSCETSDSVFLDPNLDATGFRQFKDVGFLTFLRRYFSIKSAANPISWSVFVILAAPKLWVVPNLIRVWFRCLRTLAKHLLIAMVNVARQLFVISKNDHRNQ